LEEEEAKVEIQYPPPVTSQTTFEAGWWEQFNLLFRRAAKEYLPVAIGQFIVFMLICFMTAVVWWQRKYTITGLFDKVGLMFYVLLQYFSFVVFSISNTYISEKLVITKERAVATYRLSAYFLAKSSAEFMIDFFSPLVFSSVVYWGANLNPSAGRFVFFVFILFLTYLGGQAVGLIIAALCDTVETGSLFALVYTLITLLLGGFYVNLVLVPSWFSWLQYISPVRYAFDALLINQFRGDGFYYYQPPSTTPPIDGREYLHTRQLIFHSEWADVGMLLLLIVVCRVVAYVILRWQTSQSK